VENSTSIKYYLAEDTIDKNDIDSLIEWLKTYPRLTKGKLTLQFEERWSRWLGRKYSIFCNSGSSANLLMFATLLNSFYENYEKLIRVVVPSVGWVTTIAPVLQLCGFDYPRMCEADKDTYGLDLDHLENICKEYKPHVVIMVQVLGVPHKMDRLLGLQKRYGFFLLEDACAAGGSSYFNKKVGSFGDMSSFSCYFGHQFSTIEGGIVSTDDENFYETMLMLRSHGWDKDFSLERQSELRSVFEVDNFHAPFVFYLPGYNLRATDLQAFIGLKQLDKLEWLIARRMENHFFYRRLLDGCVDFQKYDAGHAICSIHFGALAKNEEERKKIVIALRTNGIETRIFSAGNLGRHPFWIKRYGVFSAPVADRIHDCGFFLPNHPSLKKEDIEFIAGVVRKSLER